MRPSEKIENLIQNLNNQTRPELDARILDECFTELNTPKTVPTSRPIWSVIMHSKLTKPIAAAIIVIAALLSLTIFNNTVSTVYAIEETLQAMQQIETIHLFGKDWDNNEFEMWIQLNPKTGIPDYVYHDFHTIGCLAISRPDKSYQFNRKANRVSINSGKLYNIDTAPAKIFEQAMKASKNPFVQAEIKISHEKDAETGEMLIVVDFETDKEARKVYIDPVTKLPIRVIGLKNGHLGAIFKDIDYIEYNINLPPDIFDFEITDDMKVVDMDKIMQQINDPDNGISAEGLSEQEAAQVLMTDYWNAVIIGDLEAARKLAPAHPEIIDGSQISEIVQIGKPYIQNGCGIGKVVPCRLRYMDGTLKEIRLIMRYRKYNGHESYTIAGTWGGVRTIKE